MVALIKSDINGYFCPTDPGEPSPNSFSSPVKRLSTNDVENNLLTTLVRNLRVLEIGTGLGVSTRALAQSATNVVTVDIDPWVKEHVAPELPGNVVFSNDNVAEISPAYNNYFDAAFIDGMHTYEQCCRDTFYARHLVCHNGLLIFHDFYIDGVKLAVIKSGLPFVHIQTTAGMALAWNDPQVPIVLPIFNRNL